MVKSRKFDSLNKSTKSGNVSSIKLEDENSLDLPLQGERARSSSVRDELSSQEDEVAFLSNGMKSQNHGNKPELPNSTSTLEIKKGRDRQHSKAYKTKPQLTSDTSVSEDNKSPKKVKRKRRMTKKAQEGLIIEEGKRKEKQRLRRPYKKRTASSGVRGESVCKVAVEEGGSLNEEDDSLNSLDVEDISCCLCNCSIDFSERETFLWQNENDGKFLPSLDQDDENVCEKTERLTIEKEENSQCELANGSCDNQYDSNSASSSATLINEDERERREPILHPKANIESVDKELGGRVNDTLRKIPSKFYDRENALLICDTCNRSYHQRCHFVPVFCIPRGEWHCLICQFKNGGGKDRKDVLPAKRNVRQNKKANKNIGIENAHDASIILGKESYDALSKPISIAEIDTLFPQVHRNGKMVEATKQTITHDQTKCSKVIPAERTVKDRFEFQSAPLKASLLQRELFHRIKTRIDLNLSRVRLSQNTIRAYSQTDRARKTLLDRYEKTGTLPQEFNQSMLRMAESKQKIRGIMTSVQRMIQNRNDRLIMEKWLLQQFTEEVQNEAKHCSKESQASPFSKEDAGLCAERKNNGRSEIESKLFTGLQRREEPRFSLEDYDGDYDGCVEAAKENVRITSSDELSKLIGKNDCVDDPTDKVKCMMCFSGHVEHGNDVIMCDGEHCFRAFHMHCLRPKVTQQMLDEDENGTFFCPFCTAFANLIHYVEDEYFGDETAIESSASWEKADDIFPEADFEFIAASAFEGGLQNNKADEFLSSLLGIEIEKGRGIKRSPLCMNKDEISSSDDESDNNYSSDDSGKGSSDAVSSIEWDIDKSEVAALSSDSSDSSDEKVQSSIKITNGRRTSLRRKATYVSSENESRKKSPIRDIGALDESNILPGRRKRTKVDYRRLNDALFGDLSEIELALGDDDEYEVGMELKKNKKKIIKKAHQSKRAVVDAKKRRQAQPTRKLDKPNEKKKGKRSASKNLSSEGGEGSFSENKKGKKRKQATRK